MKARNWILLLTLPVLMVLLANCGPAPTPETVTVVETVVVEKEVEGEAVTVVETVVVEKEVEKIVEKEVTAAPEQITLLVWDQFTDETANAAAEKIYGAFMEQYPHIQIEREVLPNEQMRTVAKTSLASGTGPDVIYHDTGPGQGGVLARGGLLIPLDSYAAKYDWDDRVYDLAHKESTFDGKLYGMGLEMEYVGLFYNKTLFEQEGLEAPQTFEELMEFCGTARELGYIPMAFSMNPGWQSYHLYSAVAYNVLGEEAMSQLLFNNRGAWDTPEITEAIELFFVDLKNAGCFVDDVNSLTYDDANDLFFTGQALIHPTGTWLIGQITENMGDTYEVGLIPMPANEDGEDRYYPVGIGSSYFISAQSEHPDEAALFIEHVFSPESVKIWMEEANFIPPVPFDPSGWDVPPLLKEATSTLQASSGTQEGGLGFYINHAAPEAYNQHMRDGFQAVLADLKTPEELAAEFQQLWDEGFK